MRSDLDDGSVLDNRDKIGFASSGDAMGNDECGPAGREPRHRLLHNRLAVGVESSGRLIHQQDRRVAKERARDSDALAFAAGKPRAAFPNRGVIAAWNLRDECVRASGLGCSLNVSNAGPDPSGGNVRADRIVEKHRALIDDGDRRAKRCDADA